MNLNSHDYMGCVIWTRNGARLLASESLRTMRYRRMLCKDPVASSLAPLRVLMNLDLLYNIYCHSDEERGGIFAHDLLVAYVMQRFLAARRNDRVNLGLTG